VPQVDSITFVVDISGSEVPFTSLRKTAIAECQPLGKIATAAFEKALSELQAANPHALKTKEDLQREEKRETIAYASRAIAKLVAFAEVRAYY
jgi:DNA topoisomerase VI subunit B